MMPDGVYTFKRTPFILTCKTTYLYIVYRLISNCLFFIFLGFCPCFFLSLSFLLSLFMSSPFFPSLIFLSFTLFLPLSLPSPPLQKIVVDVGFYKTLLKEIKLPKWLRYNIYVLEQVHIWVIVACNWISNTAIKCGGGEQGGTGEEVGISKERWRFW